MWYPMHRLPHFAARKRKNYDYEPQDSYFLSKPRTERLNAENVKLNGLEIGHSSIQGYRPTMEDSHIISSMTLADHTLVAILDGHAGAGAAALASSRFLEVIESTNEWKSYSTLTPHERIGATDLATKALIEAFITMDDILRNSTTSNTSGSTAVVTIITPTHILTASVGDSRCVIGTSEGVCIAMAEDHKPNLPEEKHRIERAGGMVMMNRVNGELAMSRALGDFQYKEEGLDVAQQMVTCVPDVAVHERGAGDAVVVLACDGVWDVMENADAVSYLVNVLKTKGQAMTAQEMADDLVDISLTAKSSDNISALVVLFSDGSPSEETGAVDGSAATVVVEAAGEEGGASVGGGVGAVDPSSTPKGKNKKQKAKL